MTGTLTLACGSFSPAAIVMILALYYAPLVLAGLFTVFAIAIGVTSNTRAGFGIRAVPVAWAAAVVAQFALWQPLLKHGF